VKIALAEKKIPFQAIDIKAAGFDKEDPDFKKASPHSKVPAIVDGDVYMSEAYEINEYLDKKYPQNPLMPKDEAARRAIREWVASHDKKFVLKIGLLVIETLLKPKDQQSEETKQKLRAEIAEGMKAIDAQLAGKEYLFGAYSLADVSITPHIAALPILGTGIPADLQNMTAWFKRIQARPSFLQSVQ
jgi:glutathione S-transferase